MQGHKRILGSDTVRRALCWLGAQYIRFVHATGHWSVVRGDIPQALWERGEPFILCFWHGRLLMMPYCWNRRVAIHMLISRHRDGKIIARTVGHFGIRTIAGSSKRGGAGALRAMLKALQGGECVGITPDGPRGPRMRASDGVVAVARLAGVPIVPATFAADRRKVLGSWDRFVVAWPFASGVLAWGEPIRVERDADEAAVEAARARVEDALNALTAEADALMGAAPIEPAPPGSEGAAP
ncbi:MAG: lysophospholipid acyltransferase family protein [Rhodospirillales bacterium]|nr:lysophospholipid acyltransferase family protein [Rhodospirillales bacterium]